MPQLKDVDGKTVPVLSRKLRNPPAGGGHYINSQCETTQLPKNCVWVLMTTKGKLFDANIPLYGLQQTADGWEYLVREADLIKYLRTVTPPFRVM